MFKKLILASIRFYQHYLSFDSGLFKYLYISENACRFTPRCSEYTYQAINKYGILKGMSKGLWRILRCNPWNPGGDDPLI